MRNERPTMADMANFLVDWNEKAAAWLSRNVEANGEIDETDEHYGLITVFFDKDELDRFMRNQRAAAELLDAVAMYVAESEAA